MASCADRAKAHNPPLPALGGTYALALELRRQLRLVVGRLGAHTFRPGIYLYVGSALGSGGLRARLGRHLRERPRPAPHWHLDYLLPHCRPLQVWWTTSAERLECPWAALIERHATRWPPGFGASDCRCPGHLLSLPDGARLATALRGLRAASPGSVQRLILPAQRKMGWP